MSKYERLIERLKKLGRLLGRPGRFFEADFAADGLAVSGKNLSFLTEPAFLDAWRFSEALNKDGWRGTVPDVRWRAHVACWAASHCVNVEGDFADFGVHTGIFSLTVCKYLGFDQLPKRYFLYDTFEGIPLTAEMTESEKSHASSINSQLYFDCFAIAERNFSHFANARLIKGILPASLSPEPFEQLAFVHIDLNNAAAELQVIDRIWPCVSPGGIVLLDDYAFAGYEAQYEGWNAFCASRGHKVLSLPTGQGMILKHQA